MKKYLSILLVAFSIYGLSVHAGAKGANYGIDTAIGCEIAETPGNVTNGTAKEGCTAREGEILRKGIRGERQGMLRKKLEGIVAKAPGKVGVAVAGCGDTVTVNNGGKYPMMSVFKLHQALAVADMLEGLKISLDTVIAVRDAELDRQTWSPMLKDYISSDFEISVRKLLEYSITSSDNNASNLLFRRFVTPKETDRFVKGIAADSTFQIQFSEEKMKNDHDLSYQNFSSPLSAALLIKQVFETDVIGSDDQKFIRDCLSTVTTGCDRLGAVCSHGGITLFAHKTGSGYRNDSGELMAHNDVGYFKLSDGESYSVAVFIRDFSGTEDEASQLIARISEIVYQYYANDPTARERR